MLSFVLLKLANCFHLGMLSLLTVVVEVLDVSVDGFCNWQELIPFIFRPVD
jgi:hypothetical protein